MKVVILAGGYGTRLSEFTESIPKPMLKIGGRPILWHIMNYYSKFGFNDFVVALGYKSEIIKEFFLNYHSLNSDFTVDLNSGRINYLNKCVDDWKVSLIYTGEDTMTGGRVKRLQSFIGNETFMLTYGDGLSNINLSNLLKFHKAHKKMVTVSAVRPVARFGNLMINNHEVINFKEKPQTEQGWINGGFLVVNPEFFDFIEGDKTILEKDPLERVAKIGELMAFQHDGYWQCMDTKRDKDALENLWNSGSAPWNI